MSGVEFDYDNVHFSVVDNLLRTVKIDSPSEIDIDILYGGLCEFNTLCMLGEGYLFDINNIIFDGSSSSTQEELERYAKDILESRALSYYKTRTDFYGDKLGLLPPREYADSEVMGKWANLFRELIFPLNAFFYMSSIDGLPLDMRTAYFTECFEPLAKYHSTMENVRIAENERANGDKYGDLFNSIKHIVLFYGSEVFRSETSNGSIDDVIQKLVNNRVRMMHLKRDIGNKILPSSIEMITFSRKLHILYRHTLLQCIGVDKGKYKEKLEQCVGHWDKNHIHLTNSQEGIFNGETKI